MEALRHVHPGAEARARQAVPDADRGRVLDLGSRHGGDGSRGAGEGAHGRRGRDRGRQADDARRWSRAWRCSASCWTRVRRATTSGACCAARRRKTWSAGQVLAKPGSITPHTKFKAEVYVLTKEEGGRHTPFFKGYRPQFYFRTTDVTGIVELPEGTEMVMPGDNIAIKVDLITPIAMDAGSSLRDPRGRPHGRRRRRRRSDRVAGHGRGRFPEDPHPHEGVRPQAARHERLRDPRHVRAHGLADRGADPAADLDREVHRSARAARRQEVARAVRDPHAPQTDRHPRPDARRRWTRS